VIENNNLSTRISRTTRKKSLKNLCASVFFRVLKGFGVKFITKALIV